MVVDLIVRELNWEAEVFLFQSPIVDKGRKVPGHLAQTTEPTKNSLACQCPWSWDRPQYHSLLLYKNI